ncbi:MAG: YjjG family noncanonical pyrimidine nucleotidase [Saprospiraceae bacterium]|nr:YjjG family noncanonical pyrimidine nucleotidase [Saprospiraceae bacterium]
MVRNVPPRVSTKNLKSLKSLKFVMPKPYKHLFFDLDHTLWDFEKNAQDCLLDIYEAFNLKSIGVEDALDFCEKFSVANHHCWALLEQKRITVDQLRRKRFKDTFANLGIEIEEAFGLEMTDVFLELLPTKKALIEGTIEVLDYLKPNYQLHILSNGYQELQGQKMRNSGIFSYFEEIITVDNAKALKPDKAIFDYALKCTKASVSNSLMIGDNYEADIKGALNARLDAVFYNPARQKTIEKPTFDILKLTELTYIL